MEYNTIDEGKGTIGKRTVMLLNTYGLITHTASPPYGAELRCILEKGRREG